jgi:hypothetical protein
MKLKFLVSLALFTAIISCSPDDEPEYSPIPELIFKEYEFVREEINGVESDYYNITFEYIDGDGDIGGMNDIQVPNPDSIEHSVYVDYFERNKNGRFNRVICALGDDTTATKLKIPSITPTGNNKAIRGEMEVKVFPCPVPFDTIKTIKFSMFIYDRALNKSNVVESPEITYETQIPE